MEQVRQVDIYLRFNSKILNINVTNESLIEDSDSMLDIILLLYCEEVQKILRLGLIKRYRIIEQNTPSFRGKLLLSKHIAKNSFHAELFYTQQSVYDKSHAANILLLAALRAIPNFSNNSHIIGLSKTIAWQFPELELPDNKIRLFKAIKRDKKLVSYKSALIIAELILKRENTNVYSGSSRAFAIMFDMNLVFERYIAHKIRQFKPEWKIQLQQSK